MIDLIKFVSYSLITEAKYSIISESREGIQHPRPPVSKLKNKNPLISIKGFF